MVYWRKSFMTFDEQLRQAFETLTEQLRGEIDRESQRAVEALGASALAERDRAASEARADAERSAADITEAAVQAAREQGLDEGLALGRGEGREEGRRQAAVEAREQAEREAQIAIEAAVAAARDERVVHAAAGERLAESVRAIGRARSLTEILDTLVEHVGRDAARARVWLVRGDRLRHWRSAGFDPAHDDTSGDLSSDEGGATGEAARTNTIASRDGRLAVPIAMSGQVVAVLCAEGSSNREGPSNPEPQIPNPFTIEVLTRYAARSLEALTAFKAARALTERPGAPDADIGAEGAGTSAEDDASARRYARLLVSDIKMYHEAAVIEGRRDRDLASRLGGEIARARVAYEQRVPAHVRQRADYFHDELVHTLADGDVTLLQLT
jgi:hypothetical protein